MSRPNILLIQADQLRWDCLASNGRAPGGLRTPHLDRLAAEGVSFPNAFCPVPMCMPSRCSLMTGVWPSRHGVICNLDGEAHRPLPPELPTFSALLAAAGYRLGLVGVWHVDHHRQPGEFGFHEYVPAWQYGEWRKAQHLPPRPRTNGWLGETDPHIAPEQSSLAWQAGEVVRLIRQAAAGERPWLIRWDPPEPHLPNVVPEPHASMYPPRAIRPWDSFGDDLAGKPYIQAQQRRTWGLEGWTWEDWAPLVGRYLGEVSLLDEQVGRVLACLDELHLAEDTLVAFTADHGDLCGAHGMIDKHFVLYDDVVRVPLVVRWPARLAGRAGAPCPAFVCSQIDLARTICDAAGLTAPDTFAGQNLLSLADGSARTPREDIFASYSGNQFGAYSQRMVRDARWKYVWNATAEDELYHLAADPGEVHNLAADAAHATELARLRARLAEWMEQTGDILLNQWTRRQLLGNVKCQMSNAKC